MEHKRHFRFGKTKQSEINFNTDLKAAGILNLEKASVNWFLSIDKNDLHYYQNNNKIKTYRSMKLNGSEIDLSKILRNYIQKATKKYLKMKDLELKNQETRLILYLI